MDFEKALEEALERHLRGQDGKTPDRLEKSIRYSLLAPGKRIRPRLVLASGKMLGLPKEQIIPPAIALEMAHCFTLIHDDLPCMDDDDFRRGIPSNHREFDEATALLAGDSLMALAMEAMMDVFPLTHPPGYHRALRRLVWAIGPRGVIGGQVAETQLTQASTLTDLRAMHASKTGALFSAAILIPADLIELDLESPQGSAIVQFAEELGRAFQVADDLEDAGQDSKGANIEPGTILAYLNPDEARSSSFRDLSNAASRLESEWDESSRPLREIANEVLAKLKP